MSWRQGSADFALVYFNSRFQVNFRADLVKSFNLKPQAAFLRVELSPNLALDYTVAKQLENCLRAEHPFSKVLPIPGWRSCSCEFVRVSNKGQSVGSQVGLSKKSCFRPNFDRLNINKIEFRIFIYFSTHFLIKI